MLELRLPERRPPAPDMLTPSYELLEQMVAEYEAELDEAEPSLPDCFFTFIPARLMDRVLVGDTGRFPTGSYLWLMHLSGYYGGAFLRQSLRSLQLETMTLLPGARVDREVFERTVEAAADGCRAALGDGEAALVWVSEHVREVVATFGYIRGSTLHGASLPAWRGSPASDLVVPGGLLWCGYRNPKLDLMPFLYDVSERLEHDRDPRWRELASWIAPLQEAESERGRIVWQQQAPSLARLPGFSGLIEVSANYLEYTQAAALLCVRSLVERDGGTAGVAAVVSAHALLGNQSYALGLIDSSNDDDPENARPVLRT